MSYQEKESSRMLAQNKKYNKIHESALIASLLLHSLFLGFLLYLYHHQHQKSELKKDAEIIFMPPETHPQKKSPSQDDEWATTKPTYTALSSLNHELQDTPPTAINQNEVSENTEQEQSISDPFEKQEEGLDKEEKENNQEKIETPIKTESIKATDSKQLTAPLAKKKKKQRQKMAQNKNDTKPSEKSTPTFADLVKGFSTFMEQTKHGVESRIHTLGKDGKKPTDQQLKYERYIEKIIICLETSLHVNRAHAILPPVGKNPRVTIALNRRGNLTSFKIIESSGAKEVDDHIARSFYDAGSSFPPIPQYIPDNPLMITFTVNMTPRW